MMFSSWGISKRSRMAVACSITGRSEADPTRIPTSGLALSANCCSDVPPVVHPLERDQGGRGVRALFRLGERRPQRADREHPSPCRHHSTVPCGRARMEDPDIFLGTRLLEPRDLEPGLVL